MMNPTETNIMNMYNNYSLLPLSGTTTASENIIPSQPPPYNPFIAESLHQKAAALKSDSTLTYNNNNVVSVPRKRSRETINNYDNSFPSYKNTGNFSFLGEDISPHIHSQQHDIDNLISQHMEKVRVEIEEKRKKQARRLVEAIDMEIMKKMKAKEEEMQKIARLNMALEDRVKSLYIENQIWRDVAQTNEATANELRSNLEQVLTQMNDDGGGVNVAVVGDEDAESCCGSNDYGWRRVGKGAQDKEEGVMNEYRSGCSDKKRLCRNCGKEESCVLILPCRHLCLCTICGSTIHSCPICKCPKNASVHVNMT